MSSGQSLPVIEQESSE